MRRRESCSVQSILGEDATVIISAIVGFAFSVLGFSLGAYMGRRFTRTEVLQLLNHLVAQREKSSDVAAAMELPGLTLFRSIFRTTRF